MAYVALLTIHLLAMEVSRRTCTLQRICKLVQQHSAMDAMP